MAVGKGQPASRYAPEVITSLEDVFRELDRLSGIIERGHAGEVDFLNVEPEKRYEGLITGADGTNWNPGAGKGVYAYYSAAWHLLG